MRPVLCFVATVVGPPAGLLGLRSLPAAAANPRDFAPRPCAAHVAGERQERTKGR
jgi:hypothetical protein